MLILIPWLGLDVQGSGYDVGISGRGIVVQAPGIDIEVSSRGIFVR